MTIQKSLANGDQYGFGTKNGVSTTLFAENQSSYTVTGSITWSGEITNFSIPPKKQITLFRSARGNGEPVFAKNTVPKTEPLAIIKFTFTQGG
ncbi:hypothetical protein [Myxococcus sp. NMCA1]|uniref:hypothetical protein n=1 Tax=Myxococcus sp. NMCA1 TaxID=2996785 RepID=UPI0022863F34|nr:hypothetical protein [Myxococcus sp. NMCA1]WAM23916.1 hypothetical protein OZ403_25595 [Myxococcus sp. NMCA1]